MEENRENIFYTDDLIRLYKEAYCRSSEIENTDIYVNITRFTQRLLQHLPTLKRVKSGKTVVLSFDQGLSSALNVSKSDTLDKDSYSNASC